MSRAFIRSRHAPRSLGVSSRRVRRKLRPRPLQLDDVLQILRMPSHARRLELILALAREGRAFFDLNSLSPASPSDEAG